MANLLAAADNAEDTSGMTGSTPPPQEVFGVASVDVDLSHAHLELCLKLNLPLAVVITKLDLASRAGLKNCLSKVLSTLKAAGRKPSIQPDAALASEDPDLLTIPAQEIASTQAVARELREDPTSTVPIILTSAVRGNGITKLHALLHELPIPRPVVMDRIALSHPQSLFHIEDVYSGSRLTANDDSPVSVLSGHVKYGKLSVGDVLVLGPYSADLTPDDSDSNQTRSHRPQIPTARSFPGALPQVKGFQLRPSAQNQEWQKVKVASVRNLRLPTQSLDAGQIGTVGIVPIPGSTISSPALTRIRKGMILASGMPSACRVFEAEFARRDVEGLSIRSGAVVYTASVRASAKVIAGAVVDEDDSGGEPLSAVSAHRPTDDNDGFGFGFEDDRGIEVGDQNLRGDARLLVTFQFIATREYVEVGSQVLIMPGGGPGLYGGAERGEKGIAGLEGFAGKVARIVG
jgi:hypothetical protein